MYKFNRITAAVLLLTALLGLAACGQQTANADFLPESRDDKLMAVLPEDWQWLESWQTSPDVPLLLLVQGENCLEAAQFSRSWGCYTDEKQEEIQSYIACGISPLQAQEEQGDLPQPAGRGAMQLVWQAEPSEVTITAYAYDEWQQRTCGNTEPDEILHTELVLAEDGSFELLADEHSYVYVIGAKWQAEAAPGLGGSSEWAFYVE